MNTGQGHDLTLLDNAHRLISEATSPLELKSIRDRAEAMRVYAKSAALGMELQNRAAEMRLRAERQGGRMLADMCPHGGHRHAPQHGDGPTLAALGISRVQSQRWRRLARIPEPVFEAYLCSCRTGLREVTEVGLLRWTVRCTPSGENTPSDALAQDEPQVSDVAAQLAALITEQQRFACICIYPPWPSSPRRVTNRACGRRGDDIQRRLAQLPLAALAASHCHLHVWAGSDRLGDCVKLCAAWGFTYRAVLVCHRPAREYGPYWCSTQDFLLLATKGTPEFRGHNRESSVYLHGMTVQERRELVRRLVEQVSPPPRLEVFAEGTHDGWKQVPHGQGNIVLP